MIDHAIYSKLSQDSNITAIVGQRIYPVKLPQEVTIPAIRFSRVSTTGRIITHSGSADVAKSRYQFSCYAEDILTAKNISEKIRQLFHGQTFEENGEEVFNATAVNEVDLYDDDLDEFNVVLDIIFFHKEN